MNTDLLNNALKSNNYNKEPQKKGSVSLTEPIERVNNTKIKEENNIETSNNLQSNNILDSIICKDYGNKSTTSFYLYDSIIKEIKKASINRGMKDSEFMNELLLTIFKLK